MATDLRDAALQAGRDLVGLIDQFSPIVPMVWRGETGSAADRLAPDNPYLPELRTRFGDRVIDSLTPAAPPPRRDEDDDVDCDGASSRDSLDRDSDLGDFDQFDGLDDLGGLDCLCAPPPPRVR